MFEERTSPEQDPAPLPQSIHIVFFEGCFTKAVLPDMSFWPPKKPAYQAVISNVTAEYSSVNSPLALGCPVVFVATCQKDPKRKLNHYLDMLFHPNKEIFKETKPCGTIAEERDFFMAIVKKYAAKFPLLEYVFCYVADTNLCVQVERCDFGSLSRGRKFKAVYINAHDLHPSSTFNVMEQAAQHSSGFLAVDTLPAAAKQQLDGERKLPARSESSSALELSPVSNQVINKLLPEVKQESPASERGDGFSGVPLHDPFAVGQTLSRERTISWRSEASAVQFEVDAADLEGFGTDGDAIPLGQMSEHEQLDLDVLADAKPTKRCGCC